MPRERIHNRAPRGVFVGGPNHGQPYEGPRGVIDIGWANGQHSISVVSTFDDGGGRATLDMVNNWLDAAHMAPIDVEKLAGAIPPGAGGLYAYLETREDVNRLIRILRRARDAAFGKDE